MRNIVPLVMFLVFLAGIAAFAFVVVMLLRRPRGARLGALGAFGGAPGQATIVSVGARSGLGDRILVTADVLATSGGPPMRVTANVRVPMLQQDVIRPGATLPCRYMPGNPSWLVLVTGPSF